MLEPRKVVYWNKGQRYEFDNVIPTPFGKERADEIFEQCKADAKHGPWTDQLSNNLTHGEIAFVHCVWDCMNGNSSFSSAFFVIRNEMTKAYLPTE